MNIAVTGGCGFIGSNFIRLLIEQHNASFSKIANIDKLTYAGVGLYNDEFAQKLPARYQFFQIDIADRAHLETFFDAFSPSVVFHFAAESHVDRSIYNAQTFIHTNIVGTQNLIDLCRRHAIRRFIHVSTDEVYGALTAKEPPFSEASPLNPTSPYAASKTAADLLVLAAFKTHGFPAVITRCSNNYGPYQFPEKLIPLMIQRTIESKPLPVYGQGKNIRDWIYVEDHCNAIWQIFQHGKLGEIYNISSQSEHQNIEIVKKILVHLDRPQSLITFVKDRPAHDFRYAMDSTKIKKDVGWRPKYNFEAGLQITIEWYRRNTSWLKDLEKNLEHRRFKQEHYQQKEESP